MLDDCGLDQSVTQGEGDGIVTETVSPDTGILPAAAKETLRHSIFWWRCRDCSGSVSEWVKLLLVVVVIVEVKKAKPKGLLEPIRGLALRF